MRITNPNTQVDEPPQAGVLFSSLLDRVADLCGAVCNFDDIAGITHRLPELRLRPEQYVHHGPYCAFRKHHGQAPGCSRNKDKSKAIAASRREPFAGCCPFGVWDLAWPILDEGELVGVLYGGEWQAGEKLADIKGKSYPGHALPTHHAEKEATLRRWLSFLASYLELALSRARLAGEWPGKKRPAAWYVEAARERIRAAYTEEISLSDVASRLGVNAHHLGQILTRETGKSFRALLLAQRLAAAKELLLQGTLVNQAAAACGFTDANYFSASFTRHEGCSPRAWRLAQRGKHAS